MPSPSQLSIATSAVTRLLKEEFTYREELVSQERRLQKMQDAPDEDENQDFRLEQEKTSIKETKAVFGPLRERIAASTAKLEEILEDPGNDADAKEVEAAKEVLKEARSQ